MADLIVDFRTFFIAQGITDAIFLDSMLEEPDTAFCIYEYVGATPGAQIAGADRMIQIVSRHTTPAEAKANCSRLYHLLESESGVKHLTPERWGVINLKHPPVKLKVDSSGRTYYFFNLVITTYID